MPHLVPVVEELVEVLVVARFLHDRVLDDDLFRGVQLDLELQAQELQSS